MPATNRLAPLLLTVALCVGLVCTPPEVSSADATSDVDSSAELNATITTGLLDSKVKEVESSVDLDDNTKARLIELYRKAMASLEATKSYDAKATSYTKALQNAPTQTAELRKQIEALQARTTEPPKPLPTNLGIDELEQRLAKEQSDAAAIKAKVDQIEKDLDDWSQRPAAARERIAAAKAALEALDAGSARPPPDGETPSLAEARRWVLDSRQLELGAEIVMLDREVLSLGPRQDLGQATRDKQALDLKLVQARKRALEEQINQRRLSEAEKAKAEAQAATRAAADKHPLVQRVAEENADLTEELTSTTAVLNQLDDQLATTEAQAKRISEEFRTTRQRLELSGLSQALGQVLLDRRQQLPESRAYRRAAKARDVAIAEGSLRQIRHTEERLRLRDLDTYLGNLLSELPSTERTDQLRGELGALLERRRDLLTQTQAADDAYLRALDELDYASDQLMQTVETYQSFLAERLLWVRSTAPVGLSTITALPAALAWFLAPANWLEVGEVLLYEATSSPLLWLLVFSALIILWKSRNLRQALFATAEPLRRVRTDGFRYSLQGLLLTALLGAPVALLSAALGWRLTDSVEATGFTKAVGFGLLAVSTGIFSLRTFSLLCIAGGVADRHFHWSGQVTAVIRRNFAWALWLLTPIAFAATMLRQVNDASVSGSLGRITAIALMIGLTVFTARLAHPSKGVLQNIIAEQPQNWVARLRKVWYPLIVTIPVALVALALGGYTYTAGTLLQSFVSELWLALGLTTVHQTMARWLLVTRRRLALQTALERRAARIAEDTENAEPHPPGTPPTPEEPEVDLASLDEQTRRLLNALIFFTALVGLWAIWSDVLPALSVLEDVALWHYTGMVNGKEQVVPVTLASIGLVLVIASLATVAARNLPALVEILLLRTSVSPGSRYAVKTLTGYVITAIAGLSIFSTLGLSWDQVQWLVAALGVGIGFGLQEIVANFISGIIILFERPVRVGDVVTIGDTTGAVSRIQIRAITIRNWDKQELLVPNKEFITGRLLNWTLTDTMNRIVVPVGVDYGADVAQALALMREVAENHPLVLEDPAPLITFEGFGDNALQLVLRCYLDSLDNRLGVTTELHREINDKFRAAGITIAFPQRDVHLTTIKPLDVRVHTWPEVAERPVPTPGTDTTGNRSQ